jgi:DNA-directed RNA polymerase subunit RPC12/RpoP
MKTKINLKPPKKPVQRFELNVDGEHLSIGFVPLCAPKRVCPTTLAVFPDGYIFCPYCGKKLIWSDKGLVVE